MSSPLKDPRGLAAGQGRAQLVGLRDHRGLAEHLPGEFPVLQAACADGAAVDGGAQIGRDPESKTVAESPTGKVAGEGRPRGRGRSRFNWE